MPADQDGRPDDVPSAGLLKYSDSVLGGVLLPIAALAFATIGGEPFPSAQPWLSGWAFPALFAGSLAVLGLLLLIRGWLLRARPPLRWGVKALIVNTSLIAMAALLFTPVMSLPQIALAFGPIEFAGLILLVHAIVIALARASRLRAIAMILLGSLLGTVGLDTTTGVLRFTFGSEELAYGVPPVPLWMGLLVVADALSCLLSPRLALSNYTRVVAGWSTPRVSGAAGIGLRLAALLALGAAGYYAYSINQSLWDVGALGVFAAFGLACRLFDWNRLALITGFLYLLETNLSQVLLFGGGDPSIFAKSPGVAIAAIAIVIVAAAFIASIRRQFQPGAV